MSTEASQNGIVGLEYSRPLCLSIGMLGDAVGSDEKHIWESKSNLNGKELPSGLFFLSRAQALEGGNSPDLFFSLIGKGQCGANPVMYHLSVFWDSDPICAFPPYIYSS